MSFTTEVEFLAQRSEKPIYYASSAGRNAKHNIDQDMSIIEVEVNDARDRSLQGGHEFGMHASGFDLYEFPTRVESFLDTQQIADIYETEVEVFLKQTTGCSRVHIFDHTVRASDPDLRELKNIREPANLVHNDYTPNSGFVCLRENLGDEAESLANARFQIVNLWRPLVNPVEDFPLGLVDARTIKREHLVDTIRQRLSQLIPMAGRLPQLLLLQLFPLRQNGPGVVRLVRQSWYVDGRPQRPIVVVLLPGHCLQHCLELLVALTVHLQAGRDDQHLPRLGHRRHHQ
ncbi:MAG: CmcJ/NvfI family oxidoreductase, partial [Pseudomonadota bacterium]